MCFEDEAFALQHMTAEKEHRYYSARAARVGLQVSLLSCPISLIVVVLLMRCEGEAFGSVANDAQIRA